MRMDVSKGNKAMGMSIHERFATHSHLHLFLILRISIIHSLFPSNAEEMLKLQEKKICREARKPSTLSRASSLGSLDTRMRFRLSLADNYIQAKAALDAEADSYAEQIEVRGYHDRIISD